ncbi:MAG: RNA-directed DNA polymerase [Bryobacterales bacterium]|nr:RNA-directed DNA polymerase [Bryobacterales bacterium]
MARILNGAPFDVPGMIASADEMLGRRFRWVRLLAKRYASAMAGKTRPRLRTTRQFLIQDGAVSEAWRKHKIRVEQWVTHGPRMQPAPAASEWDLPRIETSGDLADWFWIEPGELEWFADLKRLGNKLGVAKLQHYRYLILKKPNGRLRLIEMPKRRLKSFQRQILEFILDRIPVHPAAHGFVKGRSIHTFVAPHIGQEVVLRIDIADFFPAISQERIQALFRTMGYPEAVSDLLGGICTNAVPYEVWGQTPEGVDARVRYEARNLYRWAHLPQGAPTSPSLANLCAYRLDCRLAGLANAAGVRYSRYADDLAFSGGGAFVKNVRRFAVSVGSILQEEGFAANHRKTRVMRRGVQQRLTGLVVNERPNVSREEYDRLKAILTNCARHGAGSQNREGHAFFRSHLEGRVGFVEAVNPERGHRLRKILERIDWEE